MVSRDTTLVHILTLSHNLASLSFVRQVGRYLRERVIKEHHLLDLTLGCLAPLPHVALDRRPLSFRFQEDPYARSLSDTPNLMLQHHKRYVQR